MQQHCKQQKQDTKLKAQQNVNNRKQNKNPARKKNPI